MGYVSYQFETTFERSIEKLMFNVVLLILSGGWHKGPEKIIRDNIASLIREVGLEGILVGVPGEEMEVFLHDLKVLEIV
ncbi:hypothetical protein EKH80_23405 [Dyella choica]|uniref:Uncharacterized protein n=2 Tax=Dyella choica TaxID=1927959 RepID=A0A3S0RH18_9GAMM|nr:hypothetical protein EKH80_23405 [Dyella choica]